MARKKPEAMQALDAIKPAKPRCTACEQDALVAEKTPEGWKMFCEVHYVANAQARAQESMTNAALARLPGESIEKWRARAFTWLRDRAGTLLKRMPTE